MLRYFDFGFRKILPILYNTYMSDTEMLNDIICHFNEFIKSINSIEDQLNDHLDDFNKLKNDVYSMQKEISGLYDKLDNVVNELESLIQQNTDKLEDFVNEQIQLINDLINSFQLDYHAKIKYIELKMNQLEIELKTIIHEVDNKHDKKEKEILRVISNNYLLLVKYVNNKIDNISLDIDVVNPINGRKEPLQKVLNQIVEYFSKGLTARQYRNLHLTAKQYRELDLTAYQYRMYGIHKHELNKLYGYKNGKGYHYDVYGRKRKEPISSVISAFGKGITAGGYYDTDMSAKQYRIFSEKYGAKNLDLYGKFILTNHFPAMFNTPVYLNTDTLVASDFGVIELSFILKPPDDILDGTVSSHEILTEESLEKLFIDFSVEIVTSQIEGKKFVGFDNVQYNFFNLKKQLVSGGIAINVMFYNATFAVYKDLESEETDTEPVLCMIDVHGLTTI